MYCFSEQTCLEPWQIVGYINMWLDKSFCHRLARENLGIQTKTSIDWRSFCSEVVESWFDRQEPIGGDGIVVEIDESLIVRRRKYNRGRLRQQVWLFGGIERVSKKRFVIPLLSGREEQPLARDKDTLLPIIKKFILPGSTIVSDSWAAYKCLDEEGYRHWSVNHSVNFVSQRILPSTHKMWKGCGWTSNHS